MCAAVTLYPTIHMKSYIILSKLATVPDIFKAGPSVHLPCLRGKNGTAESARTMRISC